MVKRNKSTAMFSLCFICCQLSIAAATPPAPATQPVVNDASLSDPLLNVSRLGGGTRGAGDLPSLYLFLPQVRAETENTGPTIYWYLDRETDAPIELAVGRMVADPKVHDRIDYAVVPVVLGDSPRLVLKGRHKAGLMSFDFSSRSIKLDPGVYKVTVTLRQDPDNDAANPYCTGLVRVSAGELQNISWVDRMDGLCRKLATEPADASAHKERRQLLQSAHVFLKFAAPADLANMHGPEQKLIQKAETDSVTSESKLLNILDP